MRNPNNTKNSKNMDWLLKDLATGVPRIRHVVVLSADGLCTAQYGTEDSGRDTGERLAAAASGLKSLAESVATEFPDGDGSLHMIAVEVDAGFFYLMAAGERSCLAVIADEGVDIRLLSNRMRDLVARIGEHLSSPRRPPEQAAP